MSQATTAGAGSLDRTAADWWRVVRGPALVGAAVLLAALVLGALAGGSTTGALDPRAVDPDGSRAVAELLRDRGVEVEVATSIAEAGSAGAGTTLLVTVPDLVIGARAKTLRDGDADLVLLTPSNPASFVDGVRVVDSASHDERDPQCELQSATLAGRADAGGATYDADQAEDADPWLCYPEEGEASLVQVRDGSRTITIVGNPDPLTNRRLGSTGNAALALNLLGENPRLVWYLPSLGDVPEGEALSPYELVPDGVWWGFLQAMIALVLFALWRARRLGPVVTERLPVIVRAAEAVEGRARLYRRGRARDRAADGLRAGVRARVAPLLGLPRRASAPEIVDAVAARAQRTAPEVGVLLYGAAPPDDAALVRLADDLDALEREVRRS